MSDNDDRRAAVREILALTSTMNYRPQVGLWSQYVDAVSKIESFKLHEDKLMALIDAEVLAVLDRVKIAGLMWDDKNEGTLYELKKAIEALRTTIAKERGEK